MYTLSYFQIGSTAAHKFRLIDPTLGAFKWQTSDDMHARSEFTDLVNRGGLTYAAKKWLDDVKTMYQLFNDHHPKESLRKGPGVVANFKKLLEENFSGYHNKVLGYIARLFTYIRLRTINRLIKLNKDSISARKKTVQLSAY